MPRYSSKIKFICRICKKEFERWPSLVKQGQGKYCSTTCQGMAKRRRITCFCSICKSSFEARVCDVIYGKKYCSPTCRSIGRKQPHPGTWKRGIKRFWTKVVKTKNCWRWTGYTIKYGYGLFTIGRRYILAHRLSWFLYYGEEPPSDKDVCHTCDNPNCVNPDHLFLGTAKDNAQDMVSKGRQARGENHPRSRFTDDQVREIKKLLAKGIRTCVIASLYKATHGTISAIKRGETWKHI